MPMFEFRCRNCGTTFDELVSSSQVKDDDIACPDCGEYAAEKLMSAFTSGGGSSPSYAGSGGGSCGTAGFT